MPGWFSRISWQSLLVPLMALLLPACCIIVTDIIKRQHSKANSGLARGRIGVWRNASIVTALFAMCGRHWAHSSLLDGGIV
jgi:hypothetical protein